MSQLQIVNPQVIELYFVNQGGDWAVHIPDAFGAGKHFTAPVEDTLAFQFQPVKLTDVLKAETTIGVACLPLRRIDPINKEIK